MKDSNHSRNVHRYQMKKGKGGDATVDGAKEDRERDRVRERS